MRLEWSRFGGAALVSAVRQEKTHDSRKSRRCVLIGTALALAACNTVRGAARDVNSVANCTENAINGTKLLISQLDKQPLAYVHGRSGHLTEERSWFRSL